jgi:hypothetical protein
LNICRISYQNVLVVGGAVGEEQQVVDEVDELQEEEYEIRVIQEEFKKDKELEPVLELKEKEIKADQGSLDSASIFHIEIEPVKNALETEVRDNKDEFEALMVEDKMIKDGKGSLVNGIALLKGVPEIEEKEIKEDEESLDLGIVPGSGGIRITRSKIKEVNADNQGFLEIEVESPIKEGQAAKPIGDDKAPIGVRASNATNAFLSSAASAIGASVGHAVASTVFGGQGRV